MPIQHDKLQVYSVSKTTGIVNFGTACSCGYLFRVQVSKEVNNHVAIWTQVTVHARLVPRKPGGRKSYMGLIWRHRHDLIAAVIPQFTGQPESARPFHDAKTTWSYHDPTLTTSDSGSSPQSPSRRHTCTCRHEARGCRPRCGRCACMRVTWDHIKNNQIRCFVSHSVEPELKLCLWAIVSTSLHLRSS
jgi:hypothetical protein